MRRHRGRAGSSRPEFSRLFAAVFAACVFSFFISPSEAASPGGPRVDWEAGAESGEAGLLFTPGPSSPESWSTTVAKPDVVIPPPPVALKTIYGDGFASRARTDVARAGNSSGVMIVVVAAVTVAIALVGFLIWRTIVTFKTWRAFASFLLPFAAGAIRRAAAMARDVPQGLAAARPRHWPRNFRGARRSFALGYRHLIRTAFTRRRRSASGASFRFASFGQQAGASAGAGRKHSAGSGFDDLGSLSDPMLAGGARAVDSSYGRARTAVSHLSEESALRDTLESEIDAVKRRVGVAFMIANGEDHDANAMKRRQGVLLRNAARDLERIEKIARSASVDPRGAFGGGRLSVRDPSGAHAMPTTAAEAYLVLGVTASVPERALKKVVDGLRMSWHPDLANDEDDRQVREHRIKQINLAWDLIKSRHRASGVMTGGPRAGGDGVPVTAEEAPPTAA